jgi:hypothetical protein
MLLFLVADNTINSLIYHKLVYNDVMNILYYIKRELKEYI